MCFQETDHNGHHSFVEAIFLPLGIHGKNHAQNDEGTSLKRDDGKGINQPFVDESWHPHFPLAWLTPPFHLY